MGEAGEAGEAWAPLPLSIFMFETGVSFMPISFAFNAATPLRFMLHGPDGRRGPAGPHCSFSEPDFFLCWPACGEADVSHHALDSATMIQKHPMAIQKPGTTDSAAIC